MDDETVHASNPPRHQTASMDLEYLKSKLGLLKIAEFMFLVVAFASLSGYTGTHNDKQYGGRYDFFYFATIISWLIVITIFMLFFFRIYGRINVNWNLLLMVYSTVTAFMILLSSALVLDAAVNYRKADEGEEMDAKKKWFRFCATEKCGNIEAAGAFGIISTALFAVDAVLFFIENRQGRAAPPIGSEQF